MVAEITREVVASAIERAIVSTAADNTIIVKAMATITLGHRIGIRTEAQMDGSNASGILASVLATVPVPR